MPFTSGPSGKSPENVAYFSLKNQEQSEKKHPPVEQLREEVCTLQVCMHSYINMLVALMCVYLHSLSFSIIKIFHTRSYNYEWSSARRHSRTYSDTGNTHAGKKGRTVLTTHVYILIWKLYMASYCDSRKPPKIFAWFTVNLIPRLHILVTSEATSSWQLYA